MNKKLLRVLRTQRTKALNKKCETIEQFEALQDKLNEIEFNIKELLSE